MTDEEEAQGGGTAPSLRALYAISGADLVYGATRAGAAASAAVFPSYHPRSSIRGVRY